MTTDRRSPPSGGVIAYTHHLVALVGRAEAAGARLADVDPDLRDELIGDARRASSRLSLRLDASPLTDATANRVDERLDAGLPPVDGPGVRSEPPAGGGWARALKLDGMSSQDIAAVEYANALAGFDAEPALTDEVFQAPVRTLYEMNRILCRGLVDERDLGRPRRTEQAIHDGAQGRVIYHPPSPGALPGLLEDLGGWLVRRSGALPALVVAGLVHERVLEWQPFEAANGRTARAAARLVLRARGLDPHGVAVPERRLSTDPSGYYAEVAATIRRRGDLVPWLERWGEALCGALEDALARARPSLGPAPPRRAVRFADGLGPAEAVTLAEYADLVEVTTEQARADLMALERAGLVAIEPGSRGLRWRKA